MKYVVKYYLMLQNTPLNDAEMCPDFADVPDAVAWQYAIPKMTKCKLPPMPLNLCAVHRLRTQGASLRKYKA